jgi:hypothetical protein
MRTGRKKRHGCETPHGWKQLCRLGYELEWRKYRGLSNNFLS